MRARGRAWSRGDDRGAGSVLALGVAAASVLAALVAGSAAGALADRAGAQAIADAAALAAARDARWREARAVPVEAAEVCAGAGAVVARSGARLERCEVGAGGSVTVRVRLDRATAEAKAGRKGVGDGPG